MRGTSCSEKITQKTQTTHWIDLGEGGVGVRLAKSNHQTLTQLRSISPSVEQKGEPSPPQKKQTTTERICGSSLEKHHTCCVKMCYYFMQFLEASDMQPNIKCNSIYSNTFTHLQIRGSSTLGAELFNTSRCQYQGEILISYSTFDLKPKCLQSKALSFRYVEGAVDI